MPCVLRAPDQLGELTLVLTLVQEEVAWFNDCNPYSQVEIPVTVIHPQSLSRPAQVAGASSHSRHLA